MGNFLHQVHLKKLSGMGWARNGGDGRGTAFGEVSSGNVLGVQGVWERDFRLIGQGRLCARREWFVVPLLGTIPLIVTILKIV